MQLDTLKQFEIFLNDHIRKIRVVATTPISETMTQRLKILYSGYLIGLLTIQQELDTIKRNHKN